MNDNIYSEVCNFNANTVTDIKLKILLNPLIFNPLPLPSGWTAMGGDWYEYTIPSLASSACTTVQLPVVTTNKCPLVLNSELSTTDPLITCPPINQLTPIWLNNGFTPSLAANPILTCTGGNITMTATPSNGTNYVWKENFVSQPYFGNSAAQTINYTPVNGIYTSKIDVDITRNQCTQRATQDIKFSRPPTYTSNITHRTCTTSGNSLGAVDITLAPTYPQLYLCME